MRVVGAAIAPLALPLRRSLVTAHGAIDVRRGFLLRLEAEDGVAGVGEASPAYWIGETSLERTAADLQSVRDLVTTRPDAARLRALVLSPAAACAVDTALVELAARARRMATGALLGGETPARVTVCALVTGDTPDGVAADAAAAVAAGFRTLKMKVGSASLAAEVRNVEALRARVGETVALRLDANRAWTLADARIAVAALAPLGIELLEEPLRDADPHALAVLGASTSVPLALDESIGDGGDLARMVAAGATPVIVLKAARVGGPTRAVALARAAAARALRVVVTDSLESGVGMRVALHVAAALPPPRLAVGLGGVRLLEACDDAIARPLRAPAFSVDGPGFTVAPALAPSHAHGDG